MRKLHFVILGNGDPFDHQPWVSACESFSPEIEYTVVDLSKYGWLEKINSKNVDCLLARPSSKTSWLRDLYQERIDILVKELKYKVFPSYDEIRIYENKRYFSYWAEANRIPHPKTYIFYYEAEAKDIAGQLELPLVGKLNVGASGNGVVLLKEKKALLNYINKAFTEGLAARTGPRLDKGNLFRRAWNKLRDPKALANRISTYRQIAADKQKGFVLLQEFIPHQYEWRVVRIGDSFFAHKKLKMGEKASGSLLKGYENPPLSIFDFTKELTDRFGFYSVALDLFERDLEDYLVNEIQCIFGQSDPYQMLIDGEPGRYRYIDGQWQFEAGDFARNQCYPLRLEHLLKKEILA